MSKQNEPEGDQPLGTCDFDSKPHTRESCAWPDSYHWRPVSAPVPQKCPTCGSAKVEIKRLVSDETCCEYGGPTLWDPCEDAWHDNSAAPSPTRGACKANIYHESVGHTPDITCVDWVAAPVPEPARTPELAPTKNDCHMLDAIMKAAKQIHEEFDCLSDHVLTKKQIREQISAIIWKHIDSRSVEASPEAPTNADDYRKLPLDAWFFCDTPSCLERYSVQRRTEGGCKIVCSTPYTHDNAKKDMLEIVRLHEAARLSVLSGSQEQFSTWGPDSLSEAATNKRSDAPSNSEAEIAQLKLELQRAAESLDCAQNVTGLQESALAKLREQIDGARAILDPTGPEGA